MSKGQEKDWFDTHTPDSGSDWFDANHPDALTQQTDAAARSAGESTRATKPVLPTPQPTGPISRLVSGAVAGAKAMIPSVKQTPDAFSVATSGFGPIPNVIRSVAGGYEESRNQGQGVIPSVGSGLAAATGLDAPGIRERAQQGDVAGVVGEGIPAVAAAAFGPKVAEGAGKVAGKIGEHIPDVRLKSKYSIGPIEIERKIPPPPEPPIEEVAAKRAAEKVAQRRADEAAGLRRPQAEVEAERAAKQREAAFNKEASEQDAIRQRYEDAQNARMKAEKEAKNARFKSEQTHAKNLRDLEDARQKEITAQAKLKQIQDQMDAAEKAQREAAGSRQFKADAAQEKFYQDQQDSLKAQMKQAEKEANDAAAQKERLRTQHGDDLMKRQKEQDALDKAAKKAGDEEDSAKGELKKSQAKNSGGAPGNGRPTPSERFLTGLLKRSVLTPEEDAQGLRMFGDKWKLRKGEGPAGRTNRLMGDIHAMRPAREIADVATGPTAAGQKAEIPPPPAASTAASSSGITFRNALGIRWAKVPGVPEEITIPNSVPESELESYAKQKGAEYLKTRKTTTFGGK